MKAEPGEPDARSGGSNGPPGDGGEREMDHPVRSALRTVLIQVPLRPFMAQMIPVVTCSKGHHTAKDPRRETERRARGTIET